MSFVMNRVTVTYCEVIVFKRLRSFLGLCDHDYADPTLVEVPWTRDGTFLSIDRSVRGEIKYRRYTYRCTKCPKTHIVDIPA